MKRAIAAALIFAGLGCAPCKPSTLLYPLPVDGGGAEALYVCCDDDGCQGMEAAASCPPGGILYSCEQGETTMVDGKPYVICHD